MARKTVFTSKYLTVFADTVRLPDTSSIDDYTVVQKPDIVVIVATDTAGNVLTLNEYKYAIDQTIRTLPAGHIEKGENPVVTAQRELLEETGYGEGVFKLVTYLHEYPSKDAHTVHIVRATNVRKVAKSNHESTESISLQVVTPDELQSEITNHKWHYSAGLASILLTIYS